MAEFDTPLFIYEEKMGKESSAFKEAVRGDILATYKFLYQRGMWSKHHYTHWTAAVKKMDDIEMLHTTWDMITGGAMAEIEPLFEAKREAMEELMEDSMEQQRMCSRKMKHMKMNKAMK